MLPALLYRRRVPPEHFVVVEAVLQVRARPEHTICGRGKHLAGLVPVGTFAVQVVLLISRTEYFLVLKINTLVQIGRAHV